MIAAGAALLAYAGDKLVDFAAGLAERARVSPAVIGLTIVAAGTSTPELFVSVAAALEGSPAIALGNVVGSNSANVGLILGAAALARSLPFAMRVLKFEYPFMLLASWITLLLARDGLLDRLESGFFLASLVAFTIYSVWVARAELGEEEGRTIAGLVPAEADRLGHRPLWLLAVGLALSFLGLGLGARLLVDGATAVARVAGLSERVIGLTLVAVGTSLPELVASVAAALKGQREIAVTNVVGSNVFNLLGILGMTGLLRPVDVEPQMVALDLWVMLGFAALPLPLVFWDRTLGRRDGAVLLLAYAAYVFVLLRFT